MRRTVRAAAALLALAIGMCKLTCAEEISVVTRDGVRSAILVAAGHASAPTVIVLHGALVSAESTVSWYGIGGAAKRRGFAAVFPRGIDLLWNFFPLFLGPGTNQVSAPDVIMTAFAGRKPPP